jgi:hypothetical protein
MAFVVIDRITMPELAAMSADKIAAVMLGRAPLPSDVIVELTDPTLSGAEPPKPIPFVMPSKSPRKPIKSVLKDK